MFASLPLMYTVHLWYPTRALYKTAKVYYHLDLLPTYQMHLSLILVHPAELLGNAMSSKPYYH